MNKVQAQHRWRSRLLIVKLGLVGAGLCLAAVACQAERPPSSVTPPFQPTQVEPSATTLRPSSTPESPTLTPRPTRTNPPTQTPTPSLTPLPPSATRPTPTAGLPARKIAFVSDRDGLDDLYIMDQDGANVVRLTNQADIYGRPVWSPDGRQLAFAAGRMEGGSQSLQVVNADGTGLRVLSADLAPYWQAPDWSPDGRYLLLASRAGGSDQIYRVNADGSGLVALTDAGGFEASWSPSGTRIVFCSVREGYRGIYIMEADGSQQTSLTTEASGLLYYEPRWSPDGQSIAFVADYDNYELYVMKSDGSEFRQLTSEYGLGSVSDWSPDSQQFVLVGRDDRPIYVLDVATATLTNIMSQAGYYGDPVWSPDGQSIAFVGYLVSDDDAGGGEIYSMHSDGSGLVNLTHNPSRDYGPAWQP